MLMYFNMIILFVVKITVVFHFSFSLVMHLLSSAPFFATHKGKIHFFDIEIHGGGGSYQYFISFYI